MIETSEQGGITHEIDGKLYVEVDRHEEAITRIVDAADEFVHAFYGDASVETTDELLLALDTAIRRNQSLLWDVAIARLNKRPAQWHEEMSR